MSWLVAGCVWCVLFALYLLFAGTIDATEIGTGLVVATLATAFMQFVRVGRQRDLQLLPPIRVLWRPVLGVLTDSVRVGGVLLRVVWRRPDGQVGTIARQPFRQGGQTAGDAGRRGMMTLSASLAPNGYVLHIPDGENVVLMHRLASVPLNHDHEWPV